MASWIPEIRQDQEALNEHSVSPRTGQSTRLNINGFRAQLPHEGIEFFTSVAPIDNHCGLTVDKQQQQSYHHPPPPAQIPIKGIEEQSVKPLLVIGMAFYNEEPEELRRTLVSLSDQVEELKHIVDCRIVIVSDGHFQMHGRTKAYLRALFSSTSNDEDTMNKLYRSLDIYHSEKSAADEDESNKVPVEQRKIAPPPLTYVIQRTLTNLGDSSSSLVRIRGAKDGNDERYLNMTLVLKSLNRRKHNSQEWMFAFTREKSISVEDKSRVILFMTDCGTYFEKGCLLRLVANMLDNPKCVGCTGRQRVMPAALQDCEDEGLVEKYFRQIQCFDYEASYAYSSGTFSLIGMLPVLPGPCAMWRYSALIHHRSFRPIDPLENVLTGGPRKGFLDDDDTSVLNSDASFINHHIKGKEEISEEDSGDISFSGVSESVFKTPFAVSVDLIGSRPIQENSLEHFSTIISTPPQETNLVIENLKLAEDRIPSYAIVTHGEPGSYTTWVDGAVFYFQAETNLRSFCAQRRRWTNGSLFSYVFVVLMHTHLVCGSAHNVFRRLAIWLLFFLQLLTYGLAMLTPAIFGSGLYLGLISLFQGGGETIILIVTILYTLYSFAFIWTHRYRVYVKPLFFIMAFLNFLVIVFVLAGFFRQSSSWGFSPSGIDRQLLQYSTLAVMAVPFIMSIVALDFVSLWMLIKSCLFFWSFLPTLVGSFSLYSLARVCDTTWGNRVSVAGSNFKGATQRQLADLQEDLSSNALVGLIFVTIFNGIVEFFVIFYGFNSWFIVGVLGVVFFSTFIQVALAIVYFLGKHISGLTFWQKCGWCTCFGRRYSYTEEMV